MWSPVCAVACGALQSRCRVTEQLFSSADGASTRDVTAGLLQMWGVDGQRHLE